MSMSSISSFGHMGLSTIVTIALAPIDNVGMTPSSGIQSGLEIFALSMPFKKNLVMWVLRSIYMPTVSPSEIFFVFTSGLE